MTHKFHPEALSEFEDGYRFYAEISHRLGVRFAREVKAAIGKVLSAPGRWRILEDNVRRCLVDVFPYSVLYTVERDHILIIAIMHGKRQPGYWRNRTGRS